MYKKKSAMAFVDVVIVRRRILIEKRRRPRGI